MSDFNDTAIATGAIASFNNGADDVPVKSCVVTFTPSGGGGSPSQPVSIQGYTGLTLTNKDNITTPTQTETITDTFGQTIYGGERDLTTDKASVDMTKDTMTYSYLSGLTSSYIGYEPTISAMSGHPCIWVRNWNYSQMPERKSGGIKCNTNAFPDIRINDTEVMASQYRVYFDVTGCNISSVQDFLNAIQTMEQGGNSLEIAYELATPTEITGLTSHDISTMLGDNNFYADIPNSETSVEYYKSGYGYTSVTVNQKNGNDELIATKTAKLHRIIYEGEVDVISGTGSISIGESGTEYDPPQEFTFPPISMETVEGTNVLYANEGDSTVTYRRSAD